MTPLAALALLSVALFTGGALYISVVEQPARMRLAPPAAVDQFRWSYRRAAPWQAGTAIVGFLAGVLASLGGAAWDWAVGGVLVGLVVPFTLLVVLPTNQQLLEPADDGERRRLLARWARLHWVRSALGALGLLVLIRAALRAA